VEYLIISARLDGLSLCQLQEAQLKKAADAIMIRASSICGCALPTTDFFTDALNKEIIKFLINMGYEEYTLEEVCLSFQINAGGNVRMPTGIEIEYVQFFGTRFNVDYLSRVLKNYSAMRNMLDRKFQNHIDGY
jgi:hypothetical protein